MRVPVPSAGVVDIPIIEKEVQGQERHHKVGERLQRDGFAALSSKLCPDFFGSR